MELDGSPSVLLSLLFAFHCEALDLEKEVSALGV
jgi:hypothetical protein